MADIEKVIKGLECCYCNYPKTMDCKNCPYDKICYHDKACSLMLRDALELLKEQAGTGCWEWIEEDKYRCSECKNTTYVDECMEEPQYLFCPYCGHKMTWAGR